MIRLLSLAVLLTLLAGCAAAYQLKSFTGGYSETRLGENILQVYFKGNSHTSWERVTDFSLLRAAELTLEKGFRYFLIVDSEDYSELSAYTTPSTSHTTGSAYGYGNYAYMEVQQQLHMKGKPT